MAQPSSLLSASGNLVTNAARLVRASRQHIHHTPPAGVRVLSLLDEHGPSGISRLAHHDRCSQPTMSGTVSGLVERGWVEKTTDQADARASLVHLTDEGRAALHVVRQRNAEAVARAITDHPTLTPDDLDTAVAVLAAVLEATKEGPQ